MSETWVHAFFRRLDRMEPDEIVPDFAEDACLRIGSDTAVGLQSIRHAMQARFGQLRSMRHHPREIWYQAPATAVIEADVRYVDTEGRVVDVVEEMVVQFEGNRIVDLSAFA